MSALVCCCCCGGSGDRCQPLASLRWILSGLSAARRRRRFCCSVNAPRCFGARAASLAFVYKTGPASAAAAADSTHTENQPHIDSWCLSVCACGYAFNVNSVRNALVPPSLVCLCVCRFGNDRSAWCLCAQPLALVCAILGACVHVRRLPLRSPVVISFHHAHT